MRRLLLIVFAILALVIGGCGGDDSTTSSSTGEESTATEQAEAPKKKTKPQVKKQKGAPPKQLVTNDLEEGSGPAAKAGDEVTVQYVGVNYKSGKEFDSSWSRNEPFPFELGAGLVIPGWEEGIEGMKVGGRRELIIPPELAYGSAGSPPAIPPNETLVFVVDLEAIN
ncbi:MAG TPA: FKBP-type peptidyl-prolyl cis-trans isomerase [Solirubrobacterales bacterium]|nr:FKBP-type peptidyl-prolyl cis-trans isomerase [Solirubrobacterales bacterium]